MILSSYESYACFYVLVHMLQIHYECMLLSVTMKSEGIAMQQLLRSSGNVCPPQSLQPNSTVFLYSWWGEWWCYINGMVELMTKSDTAGGFPSSPKKFSWSSYTAVIPCYVNWETMCRRWKAGLRKSSIQLFHMRFYQKMRGGSRGLIQESTVPTDLECAFRVPNLCYASSSKSHIYTSMNK